MTTHFQTTLDNRLQVDAKAATAKSTGSGKAVRLGLGARLFAASLALSGCQAEATHTASPANAAENAAVAAAAEPAIPLPAQPKPTPARAGPEMLSTVGLYDREEVTRVEAAEGTFAIEEVEGLPTLTVNGAPARYLMAGELGTPVSVTANAGLTLVGVFELPGESVAWVLVTGGAACPGSHILVPARGGRALPGAEIAGCDDRGTMRKDGGRIVFEAGGSTGSYADGLIQTEVAG